MRNSILLAWIILLSSIHVQAQFISGRVIDSEIKNKAIIGANVYFQGSNNAVQTDTSGYFSIPLSAENTKIIVSTTGYFPDTIDISGKSTIEVSLIPNTQLRTVEINDRQSSTFISSLNPIKTEIITTAELCKAACCNLSESFETNNSVDVSSTDAVTGTKQIQMLGLSGIYTQFTQENLPSMRGIAAISGLQQLPGTWIESIQISKGVGSVANGSESITGQINIELKKPFEKEQLLLNGYVNQMGRTEVNLSKALNINENWGSVLLVHADRMKNNIDRNKDGFMDVTDGNQWNVMNRWMYRSLKNLSAQFGFQALGDNRNAGTVNMNPAVGNVWHFNKDVLRLDAFGKLGYIFPGKPHKSFGVLANTQMYIQRMDLGSTTYDANQQSTSGNFIYQSIIGNTDHKFRTGLNILYDYVEETLHADLHRAFNRKEILAGGFFEYTLNSGRSTLVTGIRADHNSLFGNFITPRLHYKFQITEKTAFRLSGGRGQRTANIIEENISYLASSRKMIIKTNESALGKGYGLLPEVGWNSGLGLNTSFSIGGEEGSISADVFQTWFERQVVIDVDFSPQQLVIYNQNGNSQALSAQIDYNQTISKRFDVRISYKYTDAQTRYLSATLQRPFQAYNRVLFNLAYHSRKDLWLIDATANYVGSKRLPSTLPNPIEFQTFTQTPDYVNAHIQITRNLKRWAVYIGVENLLDVYQQNQIISANNPNSQYFDASYSWAPNFGRMIYAGFRFKITNE